MNRFYRWMLCVLSYLGLGVVLGLVLDWAMFRISHDYVYNQGELRSAGLRLSFLLGTIYAATCTSGSSLVSAARCVLGACVASFYAIMTGLIVAIVMYLTTGSQEITGERLAPVSRIVFCEWLVWGSGVGAVLGTGVVIYYQTKLSRQPSHAESPSLVPRNRQS